MEQQNEDGTQKHFNQEFYRHLDRDPFLATFVQGVNLSEGSAITITLFVHGVVVSGDLIGYGEYFKLMDEVGQSAIASSAAKESWSDFMTKMGDRNPVNDNEQQPGDDEPLVPNFIHLKDAYIIHEHGMTPNVGVLWRGRLSEVDGFMIGRVTKNTEEPLELPR